MKANTRFGRSPSFVSRQRTTSTAGGQKAFSYGQKSPRSKGIKQRRCIRMKQHTISDVEYSARKRKTRREEFLETMEENIPWAEWVVYIAPYIQYIADCRRMRIGCLRCSSAPISTCWHVQDDLSKNLRQPDQGELCPFRPFQEQIPRNPTPKECFQRQNCLLR